MKDYSMGFKNRDIDRFASKFGKKDGEPVNEKTKKEAIQQNIMKLEEEREKLKSGKGFVKDQRLKEINSSISRLQSKLK